MISTIDCCKSSCCQCESRDNLLTVHKDFWSQSLQKRTDYVYDTLGVAWHQNPYGKMDYVFYSMVWRYVAEHGMRCMAFQKLHFIDTKINLRMVCNDVCMVTWALLERVKITQKWEEQSYKNL